MNLAASAPSSFSVPQKGSAVPWDPCLLDEEGVVRPVEAIRRKSWRQVVYVRALSFHAMNRFAARRGAPMSASEHRK